MTIELEMADIVALGPDKETHASAAWCFLEGEQLSGQVEADVVMLSLVPGPATPSLEVILKRPVPVDR